VWGPLPRSPIRCGAICHTTRVDDADSFTVARAGRTFERKNSGSTPAPSHAASVCLRAEMAAARVARSSGVWRGSRSMQARLSEAYWNSEASANDPGCHLLVAWSLGKFLAALDSGAVSYLLMSGTISGSCTSSVAALLRVQFAGGEGGYCQSLTGSKGTRLLVGR
jgi:hypothetical protein